MRHAQICKGGSGRQAGRSGQEEVEDRKRRGGPWEEGTPRSTGPENSVPAGYLSFLKRAAVSAGWLRGETPWPDFREPSQCARALRRPRPAQAVHALQRPSPAQAVRARSKDHASPWPRVYVTAPLEPLADRKELGWPESARSALPGQRYVMQMGT